MNRTRFLIVAILLLFTQNSFAVSSVWKVEKGGKTLYLGGTLHLLTAKDFPLPDAFDEAFNAAEKLVLEADVHLADDPMFMAQMQSKMMYHDGRTLQSVLKTEVYDELDAYLRKRGMAATLFNQITAGYMSITLSLMEMQKLGFTLGGVDETYYLKAQKANKTISFLETPQQQIDFIAHLGEGIENEIIASTIEDMNALPSYMQQMTDDWRDGNLEGLEAMQMQDMLEYPAVYQSLLVDRNNAWLPEIEQMLTTDEVEAVFVGVLHMVGKDGLLNQLKLRGYHVIQLQ